MDTEKRILLASVLSIAAMAAYFFISQAASPRKPASFAKPPEQTQTSLLDPVSTTTPTADQQEEDVVTLESDHLRLEVGTKSAVVKSVALKSFKKLDASSVLAFGGLYNVTEITIPFVSTSWNLLESTGSSARWEQREGEVVRQLSLELDPQQPVYRFSITLDGPAAPAAVQIRSAWSAELGTNSRNIVEAIIKTPNKHLKYRQGSTKSISRETTKVTLAEQFFCQTIDVSSLGRPTVGLGKSKAAQMTATVEASAAQPGTVTIPIYVGPREYFWMERSGFQDAFPIGILEKIGLMLMVFLKWMASVTHSYGLAVIGLSIFVTGMLSPFTLISFRSMKKMQELQPKIDQLRKKYESDPKRVNQEIFALFKEHRVSPLSGCLPILLQMPVFFALWSAISHVVELRGEPFLWIRDLSMPDRLFPLPMGLDFNLLPILMAAAMYLQTKMSQGNTRAAGAAANPMAGPMMPILFGLMFYNVQSALVLYWLFNSIVSITIYRAAKL
jgi:YidC/Oxa1 family membrane protein insertase